MNKTQIKVLIQTKPVLIIYTTLVITIVTIIFTITHISLIKLLNLSVIWIKILTGYYQGLTLAKP